MLGQGGAPPPGLAALLAGAGGGQPPDNEQAEPATQDGGLGALQEIIEDFPALLAAMPDPKHVDMAVQAMRILTTIQRDLMGAQGGPAAQQGG